MIYILLGIIAISEITRLVLTHKPISKKAHFKAKLLGTKRMRWDLQLKLYKTSQEREVLRKEFEQMQSHLTNADAELKTFKGKKDEKERIKDKITLLQRDMERTAEKMNSLDMEIRGLKPSKDYPEGVTGIVDQIEMLRELEQNLKVYINKRI